MSASLAPGERVVRCLVGEEIDRVPFGVGLGWHPWGSALPNWRRATGIADLEPSKYFGYDPSFALPEMQYGFFPVFPSEILEDTTEYRIFRNERGIVAKQQKDDGSMPDWIEHPIKSPADWDRLRDRLRFVDARITEDWDKFRARLKETGEAVQVGTFPWGIFGTVRDFLGNEQVLYAFYDYPDMIRDMMNTLTTLWIALYERVAAQVQIDHIHIWEDMSGRQGSLISPAMVEEFMMPCYDRIVAFARAHGVRVVSVDTDGDCSQLVPIFVKHGINMMFPFEVQAGNDIRTYRQQYPTLGIMFGLDKRCLASSLADVDRELDKARWMVKRGRYIPGFDHLIPPDAKWENFQYAANQLKEICYQP
jgi:uroporphyrinogen decarboxylase